jgi:hypothetical protein
MLCLDFDLKLHHKFAIYAWVTWHTYSRSNFCWNTNTLLKHGIRRRVQIFQGCIVTSSDFISLCLISLCQRKVFCLLNHSICARCICVPACTMI